MQIGSSIVLALVFALNVGAFAPILTVRPTFELNMVSEIDDKTEVREYFNSEGFNRWNKIYSESDDVNSVQMDIRTGHDQTIQKILNWVQADGDIAGKTVCDCGCGVGSLAIPLAQMGALKRAASNHHIASWGSCFSRPTDAVFSFLHIGRCQGLCE
jgi:magnesium-protoporphyrin O-methyltransferase